MKEQEQQEIKPVHNQQIIKGAEKRRGTVTLQQSNGPPLGFYSPQYSILVIGDGDLSFSTSIASWFAYKYKSNPHKFNATTYDSYEQLIKLYHLNVKTNIEKLKKMKVQIHHEIDVNKLPEYRQIIDPKQQHFDRIVWNFPHAGFPQERIGPGFQWEQGFHKMHTDLLAVFFEHAKMYLKENGKILMAHKTVKPFSEWDIPGIAIKHGYKVEKIDFRIQDYPGYENRKGAGKNGGKRFPIPDAAQYIFEKQQQKQ